MRCGAKCGAGHSTGCWLIFLTEIFVALSLLKDTHLDVGFMACTLNQCGELLKINIRIPSTKGFLNSRIPKFSDSICISILLVLMARDLEYLPQPLWSITVNTLTSRHSKLGKAWITGDHQIEVDCGAPSIFAGLPLSYLAAHDSTVWSSYCKQF